jgi:hypothetical protein
MNGDVRVAFDIVKSAFVELFNMVKYHNVKTDGPKKEEEENK